MSRSLVACVCSHCHSPSERASRIAEFTLVSSLCVMITSILMALHTLRLPTSGSLDALNDIRRTVVVYRFGRCGCERTGRGLCRSFPSCLHGCRLTCGLVVLALRMWCNERHWNGSDWIVPKHPLNIRPSTFVTPQNCITLLRDLANSAFAALRPRLQASLKGLLGLDTDPGWRSAALSACVSSLVFHARTQ